MTRVATKCNSRRLKDAKNFLIRQTIFLLLFCYRRFLFLLRKPLARLTAFLAKRLAKRERRIAIEQISEHLELDAKNANVLADKLAQHFARELFTALELWRKPESILPSVQFDKGAKARIAAALQAGNGLIAATAHLGNWELLAAKLASEGWPVLAIMKRSYDPALDAFIRGFRLRYGIEVQERDDEEAGANIVRFLKQRRGIVGILMDQDTKAKSVFQPFFGKPAKTPSAAVRLALKTKAPILLLVCVKETAGYRIRASDCVKLERLEKNTKTEAVNEGIRRLNEGIEAEIRRKPAQWVWFHERWKTKKTTD